MTWMTVELTDYLLDIPEDKWRTLRMECVWKYRKWDLTPPSALRHMVKILPDDPAVWATYCNGITRQRHKTTVALHRARKIRTEKQRREYKRDYMRSYMRTKRGSKRNNARVV